MVVSINIDEPVLRPNVRPPKPRSKRGTITFIAEIDERYGPNSKRNLTRGVDQVSDPYTQPPFEFRFFKNIDLTLSEFSLNTDLRSLATPEVELVNDISLNTDIQSTVSFELDIPEFSISNGIQSLVSFDVSLLDLKLNTNLQPLVNLELTSPEPEEGEEFKDEFAVAAFNTNLNFPLPENMVTTADDPPPLNEE